ncbi:1-acyl-sn-glycerol-3-phosphate acyltransferase [bacterium]|nr:1-acyl-sn-glycerol-3-phosphate acyltransferase [bacterium]
MRKVISILLWAVGFLYFGICCTIVIVLTYFFKPKTIDPLIKKMLRVLFIIMFIPVESEGAEKIDPDRTMLFMSNHVNIFDVPLLQGYIPKYVRGVEATRQFKWPFYGWVIRRLGNIPIERENIHASIRSIHRAEAYLHDGVSIVILPEGHRTLDGKMRPFKKLPFHLAKQADVGIVPVGLSGLFHLKQKGSWILRPAPIKIKFGDPIPVDKVRNLSVPELRDLTYKKIEALIERP